ncbi:hypothetical protein [Vibrio phage vB_VpaS_CHI]|nr:hypothetical protein [Vibrio phage vB_VpaS_ALK]USL90077.1 hypothetical protein [Vibrio phage vB_VpaS_CHI]
MSYDNGDFDFVWGELTPREPMGREEFDKLYDEVMRRSNEHQIAMERLYGQPALDTETAMELLNQMEQQDCIMREEFLKATEGDVLMVAPRCRGKSHPMLNMEAIAEAARKFGEAAENAQAIFVVTDECLAQNPQLKEIALQFGGKIITSEKMPQAIDCIDELTHTLHKAKPKIEQFGRGFRAFGDGRTSKGDRRRKRQQWRRK